MFWVLSMKNCILPDTLVAKWSSFCFHRENCVGRNIYVYPEIPEDLKQIEIILQQQQISSFLEIWK